MTYGSPWDVIYDIESNQCLTCVHKNFRPDAGGNGDLDGFYMCGDLEFTMGMDEKWPDEFEEDEFANAYCTKYRDETLEEEAAPEQEKLF